MREKRRGSSHLRPNKRGSGKSTLRISNKSCRPTLNQHRRHYSSRYRIMLRFTRSLFVTKRSRRYNPVSLICVYYVVFLVLLFYTFSLFISPNSCSILATMRFCSARGGRGIRVFLKSPCEYLGMNP